MYSQNAAPSLPAAVGAGEREQLVARYRQVRALTERLCTPLVPEDYVVQSMPDASPTKWHLAHTSWFFETFLLSPHLSGYAVLRPEYTYLFNSYYLTVGDRHCRPKRGLLSRPTVDEVYQYRAHVDEHMLTLLERIDEGQLQDLMPVIEIGLNHEQQHQELMLTDLKHLLAMNPLRPAYRNDLSPPALHPAAPLEWTTFPEGLAWIGHSGSRFAYDNESPRHRAFLQSFQLASRLVTCGEYRAFMEDGGYQRGELWLSEGWNTVQSQQWQAPLYWEQRDGRWWAMTLGGMREVSDSEPVCHVSLFEADAYARWAGARLPTEQEWELAAAELPVTGNFVQQDVLHPRAATHATGTAIMQMYGDVWEWTRSAYLAYPGYRPPDGALGEYNGKFMCNQFVLRGGSCATSKDHIRSTYRNFFPPEARWQFMGFRLARDV